MVLVYCRPNSLELPAGASRPGLAAVAVVVAAVAVIIVAAAIAAAVAEQEQQDDDPPPVVAAEPVADATVVVTAHNNTSGRFSRASLLIPMLFPASENVHRDAPAGSGVAVGWAVVGGQPDTLAVIDRQKR